MNEHKPTRWYVALGVCALTAGLIVWLDITFLDGRILIPRSARGQQEDSFSHGRIDGSFSSGSETWVRTLCGREASLELCKRATALQTARSCRSAAAALEALRRGSVDQPSSEAAVSVGAEAVAAAAAQYRRQCPQSQPKP